MQSLQSPNVLLFSTPSPHNSGTPICPTCRTIPCRPRRWSYRWAFGEHTKITEWFEKLKKTYREMNYDFNDTKLVVPVTINPEGFDVWPGAAIMFHFF